MFGKSVNSLLNVSFFLAVCGMVLFLFLSSKDEGSRAIVLEKVLFTRSPSVFFFLHFCWKGESLERFFLYTYNHV